MSTSDIRPTPLTPAPTYQLTHVESEGLSQMDLLRLVTEGFFLNDVLAMVGSSNLYRESRLSERIIGRSAQTIQRWSRRNHAVRLDAQQSAAAFHYAKVLELAVTVFGSQVLAECWLGQPCRKLGYVVPLEMVETAVGFRIALEYLERIWLGVYQ
jgi:putative toxin-antitoxin system antitoxin component (TIGR02293 family)